MIFHPKATISFHSLKSIHINTFYTKWCFGVLVNLPDQANYYKKKPCLSSKILQILLYEEIDRHRYYSFIQHHKPKYSHIKGNPSLPVESRVSNSFNDLDFNMFYKRTRYLSINQKLMQSQKSKKCLQAKETKRYQPRRMGSSERLRKSIHFSDHIFEVSIAQENKCIRY